VDDDVKALPNEFTQFLLQRVTLRRCKGGRQKARERGIPRRILYEQPSANAFAHLYFDDSVLFDEMSQLRYGFLRKRQPQ